MEEKINTLCNTITAQGQEYLRKWKLDCPNNRDQKVAHFKKGKKYIKVDVGTNGKYMIDKNGRIFGIKSYGVIHLGHFYGTLDTIDKYFWGDYTAYRI